MILACRGGLSVRKEPWPSWPRADDDTERVVLEVLHSGRWAISGCYAGSKPFERRFAEAFAAFHGVRYCVPTASGSTALSVALEALGVGPGDEVLIPAVTWVACASSVANIGAVPVLIDIVPETLCMDPVKAQSAITERTSAILLVHAYCRIADLDRFSQISKETGVPLLEDCSQAHGAMWGGRRVGTFGKVAAFSMQQTKVLTSGEGGATLTDDPELYDLLQQLRADGRRYVQGEPRDGDMELEEVGSVVGSNRCLSEFQAAVLLDRLSYLDEENRHRETNARLLEEKIEAIGAIMPLHRPERMDMATHYQLCLRLDRTAFGGRSVDAIADALSCELGIHVEPVDTPLNGNILYNPQLSRRLTTTPQTRQLLDLSRFNLPNAWDARRNCLCFPNQVLLGSEEDIEDIVTAFEKLIAHSKEIPEVSNPIQGEPTL